jgi:nucleotide-binding universal stress UspA family protein
MKRIIVSTDFSTPSDKAVDLGITLAQTLHAEVLFLHAYNFPHSDPMHAAYLHGSSAIDTQELEGEYRTMVETRLQQYCDHVDKLTGGTVNSDHLSVAGMYIDQVIESLEDLEDTIVVMGTRGHGERKDTVMGSNAARTVQKSPIPVLVVPQYAEESKIRSIMYASSLLEDDIEPLATVIAIAGAFKANLDLVHIDKQATEDEQDALEGFKEIVGDHYQYDKMKFHLIRGEDVLDQLNQRAQDLKADLVVMTTRRMGGLFQKSLSQEMIFHTTKPLLVFHN